MPSGWEREPLLMPESKPPSGKCKIINIYIDPETGKVVIEYDKTPEK